MNEANFQIRQSILWKTDNNDNNFPILKRNLYIAYFANFSFNFNLKINFNLHFILY